MSELAPCKPEVSAFESRGKPTEMDHILAANKKNVLAKLTERSTASQARKPEILCAGLMLLMDGAWSAARMFRSDNHAKHVLAVAQALVAAQVEQDLLNLKPQLSSRSIVLEG